MTIERKYDGLPLEWTNKTPETIQNDCRWLESITSNAGQFSDWWTKARILQLAYRDPTGNKRKAADGLPLYAGYTSEAEIVNALRSICDLEKYPEFAESVTEEYVIKTINSWKQRCFSQAVSRNFEVYADCQHPNVFLVTSTATVSLGVKRVLPSEVLPKRFRPLFNVEELAKIIWERQSYRVTLRTHGYANRGVEFYRFFATEADALNQPDLALGDGSLADRHLYIGYQWPSEKPFFSPTLWSELTKEIGIVSKFLFVLSGLAGIIGTLLYLFLNFLAIPLLNSLSDLPGLSQLWNWTNFRETAELTVKWYWLVPTLFMFWLLAIMTLRLVVYQRDRYRAIHYGAPDLAEFFWRLDKAMTEYFVTQGQMNPIPVNLVGHSMGGLVLVNALRTLSDRFGKDDYDEQDKQQIGLHMQLDQLILASPDIPLEMLQEGRNNYVRSAIRRCEKIYLMSSDRDIVLRYLSTLGNWFTEPSFEMSGLRLGNIYLKEAVSLAEKNNQNLLQIRTMLSSRPAVSPTSAYDLFEQFNYLDCSLMKGVNAVNFELSPYNGVLIDLCNSAFYFLGFIDVHGGYFLPKTPSFKILKILMTQSHLSEQEITTKIYDLIEPTPIRFFPNERFLSRPAAPLTPSNLDS